MNFVRVTCPLFMNGSNRRCMDNQRANHSQTLGHDEANENWITISPFKKRHDRKFLQGYWLSKIGSVWIIFYENAPSLIWMISFRSANCLRKLERVKSNRMKMIPIIKKNQPLKSPVTTRAMVDFTRFYLRVFAGWNEIIQKSDTKRYFENHYCRLKAFCIGTIGGPFNARKTNE